MSNHTPQGAVVERGPRQAFVAARATKCAGEAAERALALALRGQLFPLSAVQEQIFTADTFPLMPSRTETFSLAFSGFLLPEGDSPRSGPPRWRPPDRGSGPRPESRCWPQGAEEFGRTGRHKKAQRESFSQSTLRPALIRSLPHAPALCEGSGIPVKAQEVWAPFSRNSPAPEGRRPGRTGASIFQ